MARGLLCIGLILLLASSSLGCGGLGAPASPVSSIKSYRNVPGVTADEISAIDAFKASGSSFTYGALLSTEAFQLPHGAWAGFVVLFCDFLTELFGVPFTPALYDWDALMDSFESRDVDFTGELTPTEARQGSPDQIFEVDGEAVHGKGYIMSAPIAARLLRLFTHTSADRIQTEADIEGRTLGFLEGSSTAESIRKIYPYDFDRVYVDNYQDAAQLILSGAIDAFVDEAVADPVFDEYGFIHSTVFFSLVHESVSMSTTKPDLAPFISVLTKYIDAGGFDRLYDLYKEGEFAYVKNKLGKSFTDEERAYLSQIKSQGNQIFVAYEHDNYPIDFFNDNDGRYEGVAVDVLHEIGKLLDVEFVPAVERDATWASIYDMLTSGKVHMVGQLLHTDARGDEYLWTSMPYASSYYAIMSRSDYPNLANYQVAQSKVGVNMSSGKADVFHKLYPSNSGLILFPTQTACLDALERGDIDLLMASEYMLLTQTNYREKSGLKINIKFNEPLDSYFGFHKDDFVLCSIIDKAQSFVDTGLIEISWTGKAFDYSKKLGEQRALYLSIFLAVMSALLVGTVFVLIKNINLSKRLRELAHYDALTGIYNRRFFMEMAEVQEARSKRTGIDCFVIMYDLDHFKLVNDTYGHQAGDQVLRDIAQRVKKAIRPYDILGRYGGEEFIMIMTDVKEIHLENILGATERIRQEICKAPVLFGDAEIQVSASFGVAFGAPRYQIADAINHADEALYQAKENGRNRVEFYREPED